MIVKDKHGNKNTVHWLDYHECKLIRCNFGIVRLTGRYVLDTKRAEFTMDAHIANFLEDYQIVSHTIYGDGPSYYSVIMEARV